MHLGIAVHLTGAGQQQTSPHPSGQTQHVVRAQKAGFCRFNRIALVMNRGCGAGEMPDPIHLQLDRLGHVMTDQLKARVTDPTGDVAFATREVVVEADHLLTRLHQPVDQVGPEESSTTGDEVNPHFRLRGGAATPRSR